MRVVCAGALALAGTAALATPGDPAWDAAVETPRVVTVGEAVRGALARNPELLGALNSALLADVNERAARAAYLPQIAPFYVTDRSGTTHARTESLGAT